MFTIFAVVVQLRRKIRQGDYSKNEVIYEGNIGDYLGITQTGDQVIIPEPLYKELYAHGLVPTSEPSALFPLSH